MDESQVYRTTLLLHQEIVSDALRDSSVTFSVYEEAINSFSRGVRLSPVTGMGTHWVFYVPDDEVERAQQVIEALNLPEERDSTDGASESEDADPKTYGWITVVVAIVTLVLLALRSDWFRGLLH